MSCPEVIWFDFGGVLSPPVPDLFAHFERRTGLPTPVFCQAMTDVATEVGLPMLAPIELARMSEGTWGQRVRGAIVRRRPDIDLGGVDFHAIGRQWFAGVTGNTVMVDAAHHLKAAGFRVGILTNNVAEWEPYWRPIAGLDGIADPIIDSCKIGYRKPDAACFTLASEAASCLAKVCLLIDDVLENVVAARDQGWRAIHFTGNAATLDQLTQATGLDFPVRTEVAHA